MFADELADLKDRYPARLHLVHVLSREPGESPLLSGRIDADRLTRLLASVVPAERIDEWFLCGPYGMVTEARSVLAAAGVADRAVHTELPRRRTHPGARARRRHAPTSAGSRRRPPAFELARLRGHHLRWRTALVDSLQEAFFARYLETLSADRRHLLSHYIATDLAVTPD